MPRILLVLLIASHASGCYVASISGLSDADSAVVIEELAGHWRSEDEEIDLVLSRDEWRSYDVVLQQRGVSHHFTGRVALIGGGHLFELTVHSGVEMTPALLPVHILGRLTLSEGRLVVGLLDYEWLRARMGRKDFRLPVVADERQTLLITAPRAQLRRWLTANGATPGVFSEAMTLTRVPKEEKVGF
jgi:hypothetical protein